MTDQSDESPLAVQPLASLDSAGIDRMRASLLKHAMHCLVQTGLKFNSATRATAEDITSETVIIAIENLAGLACKRKWTPEKCSLMAFLRGVIESKVSNYATSFARRNVLEYDVSPQSFESQSPDMNPLDSLLHEEQRASQDKLLNDLIAAFASDKIATILLERIALGRPMSNNDISKDTLLIMPDIINAKARIRRRVESLKEPS